MISFTPIASPLRPPFTQTNNIKVTLQGVTVSAVSHDFENDQIVILSFGSTLDVVRYLCDLTLKHTYPIPASPGNTGGIYLAYSGKCLGAVRCHYTSPSSTRLLPQASTNNVEMHVYDEVTNSYTKFTANFFAGNPAAPFTSSAYNCKRLDILTTEDGTRLLLVNIATYDGEYNGKQVTGRSFVRVFKFNGTALTYVQDIVDSVAYPSSLVYITASDAYAAPIVESLVYDNVTDFVVISSAVRTASGYSPRSLVYRWNGTSLASVANLGSYPVGIVDGFTQLSNANGDYAVIKTQPTTFPGTVAYRLYKIVGNSWTLVNTLSKTVSYNASNTEFVSNDKNLIASSEAAPTLSDLELYLHLYEITADNQIVLRRVINRQHLGIPLTNAVTIKRIPYIDFMDSEIFVCCHQYRAPGDTGFDLVKVSQNPGT